MGATFPNGIASFTKHRDLYDDVSAADINKIQDEIQAIEESLGSALTTLNTVQNDITTLENEELTLEQQEQALLSQQMLLTHRFASLRDMVASLWAGVNVYAASTQGANFPSFPQAKGQGQTPYILNLTAPDAISDPMGMWNGIGFTLPVTGYWILDGSVWFNLNNTGPTPPTNFGRYEGAIKTGNSWIHSSDRKFPVYDGGWMDVICQPKISGWFAAGTPVALMGSQSSGAVQNIAGSRLSAVCIRQRYAPPPSGD